MGVSAGLLLGALLSAQIDVIVAGFERVAGFKIFSPEVYYISSVPSQPEVLDFVVTAIFAFALALFAPLYPAWLAARQRAAEGLRHE